MSATLIARLRRWLHKANRPNKPHPGVMLRLETLEKRTVPSNMPLDFTHPPPNQTFLATVYQGELKRPIDSAGLSYWSNQLNQNVSRESVVAAIFNSNESLSREVSSDFNALLGRDPDPSGLQFYLQALRQGATPQDVKGSILGSDEFFSRVGGDSQSYLNALYGEELGRAVEPAGLAHWTPLTGDATGRTEIAHQVEASPEATQLVVATIYQDTLGRVPDAGGLAYWAGQLQQGTSQSTVVAGVLGSNEFFSRMQSFTATSNTSDPNVAATKFISEAQLFQSQPAVVPAAPPFVPVPSGGDNSGGDNSGGDVLGGDNPGGTIVIVDNSVVDNSVVDTSFVDTSVVDTSVVDNSTTDTTDYTQTPDCSCPSPDPSANPGDTGTPDTSGSSYDTSSVDNSVDTSGGF